MIRKNLNKKNPLKIFFGMNIITFGINSIKFCTNIIRYDKIRKLHLKVYKSLT